MVHVLVVGGGRFPRTIHEYVTYLQVGAFSAEKITNILPNPVPKD